jgi:hypothetical protein
LSCKGNAQWKALSRGATQGGGGGGGDDEDEEEDLDGYGHVAENTESPPLSRNLSHLFEDMPDSPLYERPTSPPAPKRTRPAFSAAAAMPAAAVPSPASAAPAVCASPAAPRRERPTFAAAGPTFARSQPSPRAAPNKAAAAASASAPAPAAVDVAAVVAAATVAAATVAAVGPGRYRSQRQSQDAVYLKRIQNAWQ